MAGRPEAAQALCTRFAPKLLAFAAADFPNDQQLAEDVMVQTLTAAAQHVRWYNPRRSKFAVWMYGVARRQLQDELRKRQRKKSVPAAAQTSWDNAADLADGQDLAEVAVARLEARRSVALLGKMLSAAELEALVLSSIEELSVKENRARAGPVGARGPLPPASGQGEGPGRVGRP